MDIYEKSRELGKMLLETKEGKRVYDARFIFDGDEEAKQLLFEYNQYVKSIQNQIDNGLLSDEDLKKSKQKKSELFNNLKKNTVLNELFEAEIAFNDVVNRVIDIIQVVSSGEECKCSGSCSSCSGCH